MRCEEYEKILGIELPAEAREFVDGMTEEQAADFIKKIVEQAPAVKYAVWILNLKAPESRPRIASDPDGFLLVSPDKEYLERVAADMKRPGFSVWVAEVLS